MWHQYCSDSLCKEHPQSTQQVHILRWDQMLSSRLILWVESTRLWFGNIFFCFCYIFQFCSPLYHRIHLWFISAQHQIQYLTNTRTWEQSFIQFGLVNTNCVDTVIVDSSQDQHFVQLENLLRTKFGSGSGQIVQWKFDERPQSCRKWLDDKRVVAPGSIVDGLLVQVSNNSEEPHPRPGRSDMQRCAKQEYKQSGVARFGAQNPKQHVPHGHSTNLRQSSTCTLHYSEKSKTQF